MANPEFRAGYVRELARMHQEGLDQKNPTLARWCMRERAMIDSSGSTGYERSEARPTKAK